MANILLELRNEKMKREEILFESEEGLSCYILLFNKYEFNFSKKIFYFKNTVCETIENINKILLLIKNKNEDSYYDYWSIEKIGQIELLLIHMKSRLETLNPEYYIVADYITSLLNYKYESSVRKPLDYITSFHLWLTNLLEGNFNYQYLDKKDFNTINNKIIHFKDEIKDKISIDLISILKEPTIIPINQFNKIVKFSLIIYLDETDIGKNVQEILYPILNILKNYKIGYEKGEIHKQDSMEINFYFINENLE